MSIEAMTLVLHHSKASATDKVILWGIANHLGDGGAYPSLETLAKYANVSVRSVSRSIAELIKLGELRSVTNGAPIRGVNKSNLYFINLRCPANCDGTMNHRLGTTDLTSRVDNIDYPGTTDMSTKPLNKPFKEPYSQKKKSHIKEDWQPSESLQQTINSKQKWATVNATVELEKFVNYHMAKGSMMVDWDRAFMTWLTNAEKWAKDKTAPAVDRSHIKGWFE